MVPVPPASRRWFVLAALMAVTLVNQIEWLVHAAVARPAAAFYAGQFDPASFFNIDVLAQAYMIVFLVAALPASWVLDRWGLGIGVGIGAALTVVGAVGKAVFATSFGAQVGFQLVLALAQPFLINAATTVAKEWFPLNERATAGGMASLSQYLGFLGALGLTPLLVQVSPDLPGYGQGLDTALLVFAVAAAVTGLAALVLVRHGPNKVVHETPADFVAGLGRLMASRDFRWTLLLFFVGLGILNAVTAMTDSIAAALGVKDSDGLLGLGLIVGGVVGAVVMPLVSDGWRRRQVPLVICVALTVPALAILVWGGALGYGGAIAAMTVLGFGLMSAGPIGFQYAAEVTAPVSESSSQGVLLLAGQVSGIALTAGMSAGGPGSVAGWLAAFVAGAAGLVVFALRMKESPAFDPRKH